MKQIVILGLVGSLFLALGCHAQESVRATLEADTNSVGTFVIHVTNISSNTLRFLDIREGTGLCGDFYEITVEKDGKRYESKGNCLYVPGDMPKMVALAPGKTYDRRIQPVAYVRRESHIIPPCEIKVAYRLTDKIKKDWKAMGDKTVDLNLTFETNKTKMEASNGIGTPIAAHRAYGSRTRRVGWLSRRVCPEALSKTGFSCRSRSVRVVSCRTKAPKIMTLLTTTIRLPFGVTCLGLD